MPAGRARGDRASGPPARRPPPRPQPSAGARLLTNLLPLVLGLEAYDLQVAAAGDVGHDGGDATPHTQQRPAQHVVVPQPQALHAVLALLHQPALPVPARADGALDTPPSPQAPPRTWGLRQALSTAHLLGPSYGVTCWGALGQP